LVHIAVFGVGLRLRACTLSIFTRPIWKVFGPNYKVCNWRSTEAVVNHSGIQLQASASAETFVSTSDPSYKLWQRNGLKKYKQERSPNLP
jgi:hypothetical protein